MAAPRKRTKGSRGRERVSRPCCFHQQQRKLPRPRRVQACRPFNVPELVYRLLNPDEHNQAGGFYKMGRRDRGKVNSRGVPRGKMRKHEKLRESSYDSVSLEESSPSVDESEYTKSVATSMDNLSRVMEATNSSVAAASENSSVSNISARQIALPKSIDNTRALLKKKSLMQIINNYVKAGIEEGKRQAKKYIRKALSFGLKSGYLIPADPHGQVIRVSPTLVEMKRGDPESRRKRRKARRGEEDDSSVDHKERRRETPPSAPRKKPRREVSPEPAPPRKRRKTSRSRISRTNLNLAGTSGKKNSKGQSRQKENRKKKPATRKREKVIYYNASVSASKSDESMKIQKAGQDKRRNARSKRREEVTEKKQNRRSRASKSPSFVRKNGKDNARNRNRDSSDEDENSGKSSDNEVNQRTVAERRKSASACREILPLEENESPANPAIEIEEGLKSPNIEESNDHVTQNID